MKKQSTAVLIFLAVVFVFLATTVQAQEVGLIPEFGKDKDVRLSVAGFVQTLYAKEFGQYSTGRDQLVWTESRVRLTLSIKDNWEVGTQINFADLQQDDSNFLREIYVGYKFDDQWKLSVGRLFLPAGYATPTAFDLETAVYPFSNPFACYAWGAMIEGGFGDDWSIKIALTGTSGLSFSDEYSFSHFEFSSRIEKKFESGAIGTALQASKDFTRVDADYTWKPISQFYLRTGLYYTDNADIKTSNIIGGYALGVYRPSKWFDLHAQLDGTADLQKSYYEMQKVENDDGSVSFEKTKCFTSDEVNIAWLFGVTGYVGKKDMIKITADYQGNIKGTRPDEFRLRGSFAF